MTTVPAHEPAKELFTRLRSGPSKQDLQAAAQLAIQVEFSTIPVYLFGLYSIQDPSSEAYQALRSVVIEEMFHVNQAANLLVGIGGTPTFTGVAVPTYPGTLPQANPNTTPWIGLHRASVSTFNDIYAAIETPAPAGAPAQGTNYDSIAQLYAALEAGLEAYTGNDLYGAAANRRPRTDIYPGKFGGKPIEVTDIESAKAGINEIVKQGEGTAELGKPLMPVEEFGVYNHYGKRTDGTYGPIAGTPYELSHFMKFRSVALDPDNFPSTYPVLSNPTLSDYSPNTPAYTYATAFNSAYSKMLRALEDGFTTEQPDTYYLAAFPLMHEVLPRLARLMMQSAINPNGNAAVGPNAAPTFDYMPEQSTTDALRKHIQASIEQVRGTLTDKVERDREIGLLSQVLTIVGQLPH